MQGIVSLLSTKLDVGWLIALTIILGLVEISPIKLNPWTAIKKFFTANQELAKEIRAVATHVDEIDKRVQAKFKRDEELDIIDIRVRILKFGEEILQHRKHTKEHFEQAMLDIDKYEKYCEENPDFPNSITVSNIKLIKDVYYKCMSGDSEFLPYEISSSTPVKKTKRTKKVAVEEESK